MEKCADCALNIELIRGLRGMILCRFRMIRVPLELLRCRLPYSRLIVQSLYPSNLCVNLVNLLLSRYALCENTNIKYKNKNP